MKFRAIFYPLVCVAIVFAIAAFLIIKNYSPNNSTAQVETTINTDNNKHSNNTDCDDFDNQDDDTQTLANDQDDNSNDNSNDNQSDNPTGDNDFGKTDGEDHTNQNQDNDENDSDSNTGKDTSKDNQGTTTPTNPNQDNNQDVNDNDDTNEDDDYINPTSPVEKATIVLNNYDSNTIIANTDGICLNYEILEGDKKYLNQDVDIIIENTNICTLMMQGAPFIYLQKQGNGKTTVKIISVNNPEIYKIITIYFN